MTVHILSDARGRRARPDFEETRFAPPEDPRIKTRADMAVAIAIGIASLFGALAIIAGVAWLAARFFH